MTRITVDAWKNVMAGETVDDGFGGYKTAPKAEGSYTLYELVDDDNCHCGWEWVKE